MSAPPVQDRATVISGSPNLWNKALNTLSVELRKSLDLTRASHAYIISRALKEAQEKKQVCAQKCWTLKKRNGEIIILRDVVEKIIVWVEKFIAVGDTAVQYDPAHAAPAWAAFRFVLQMAVNDKKAFGETIENLESVSHLITRYAILEELYMQRISAARDKLEDMVVLLYAEILTFLAKIGKYFQSSAKIRFAKSIFRFSEGEQMTKIRVLDSQISRLIEVFSVDIQIETAKGVESLHAILTSLNKPIERMVDHTSISAQVLDESQRLQLLHWLSPVPFSSHHKRHSESRVPSSGQWLLDHDRYIHWRNTSSSSIFLLQGIMGSGKTSLASAVVDSFLRESSGQASPAPFAYFYCTRNSAEAERSNPDEIMRSILRQMTVSHGSSSTVHERVLQEYERRQAVAKVDGFETMRLQAADCVRLILDTTADNPATIVIDAVDEIQPSSRHILLSALTQIVQDSLSVVKIFVTSRDDSYIHALLSDAVVLRIESEYTRKDMDDFVCQEVSSAIQNRRLLNGIISESLRHELMRVLVAGAGEMFIWVVRQIENICQMKTEADIRSAMRALPTNTLNELYEEDFTRLSRSGQNARRYAVQVFSILLCAQEALSPEALIQATAKTVSQQGATMTLARMIDICFNLVVLDFELNVVRFAHISFQEYLETRAEFAPHYVHMVAATSCLDLCLEGLPRGMETDLSLKNDFHHYSAVYWAEHCRVSIVNGADQLITSKMKEFVFDEGDLALGFMAWVEEIKKVVNKLSNDHSLAKALRSVIHSGGSPLFAACIFGLTPIIDDLANAADYDWNQTNDSGQSGLYLAAVAGHRTIVQILLQHKVFVNAFGGKFGRPLHAACFSGHTNIVEMLLDHGADPKLEPRSALEYALLADHEETALLLLEGSFEVINQAEYDSILQQAAETGSADVVQFLQKNYAPLYGVLGSSRCRAVEVAIFKGRMGVVERYMQKLSDPKTDMPKDAIATAALGGQDSMIIFLVDQGLDLDQEGVFGTALRAASITCHESTVRLLLRLGASLCVSGSFGEPLQAAAMRGHESITRFLLTHGADVNSKGGLYGTALQAAAHRGHQNIVKLLLDAGANVHQGGFARDAFHAASEGGHEGIVRLLLNRGFQSIYNFRMEPLYSMEQYRHSNLLRDASPSRCQEMKPSQDPQPGSKDWREWASVTDFSHVIEKMRGAITSELESTQPYPGYRSRKDGVCALRVAAKNGHVTVVELLLSQLDSMYFSQSEIAAALKEACGNGHEKVVKMFLDQPDTIYISKSELVAALKEACGNGHEKVVSQLLSDRGDLKDLKAAFKAAAFNGHLTVVNLLLSHESRLGLATYEMVESLTQETYECDSTTHAILDSSSRGGHLPVFRRGQDLVAQRCTNAASRHMYGEALTIAAANRQVDVFEALLETALEFDFEEMTDTLNSVCAWGSVHILQKLLQHDTKTVLGIEQYSSGLSHAVRKNNRRVVVYWLEEHPERHNLAVDPATVIGVSADGFMDILPPLIEHIRPEDSAEHTLNQCLQVASENGHEEVVEYLIREGANPNRADEDGRYLLNFAAAYCTVEVVQKLILLGADAEVATKEHGTALQAAARREVDGLSIIKTLLEANVSVPSFDPGKAAALNEALSLFEFAGWHEYESFFETSGRTRHISSRPFNASTFISDVFSTGPGAVVKLLLANLPKEKADDSRYCLLAQMACVAGDEECIELILQRGMDTNLSGNYYGTALQAASRVGNIYIADYLLKSGADVNILQGVHGTALRAAVIRGHEDLVNTLITYGADVNLRYTRGVHTDEGESVLGLALGSRNNAIFKLLLGAGAEVTTEINGQQPVLIRACNHGHTTLVQLLLARGVDVNVLGTDAWSDHDIPNEYATPLNIACVKGHLSVVRLLLDHGADIEKTAKPSDSEKTDKWSDSETTYEYPTPLIAAIRGNHPLVIRLLLDAGAVFNPAAYVTPLSEAAEDCKLEIVEELLGAVVVIGDPSTKGNALARACKSRQHKVAELLLEHLSGTQYDAKICDEALFEAVGCGDHEMVRLLLGHGVFPSLKMLRHACAAGVLEVVKVLVDTGIDVNEDDGDDDPLVHVAASHLKLDVVHFLISRGANVVLCSMKYGSPLIAALEGLVAPLLRHSSQPEPCRSLAKQLPRADAQWIFHAEGQDRPGYRHFSQCEEIVRSLLNAGAEVDTTVRKFGNALHLASYMGSEVIVRQLLEKMENANVFGGYFESPLIAGLKGNHPTVVNLLLDRGIEVNRSSLEHGSALHYACAHSSKRVIQNLLDHGADINAYDNKHGSALAAAASEGADPMGQWFERRRAIVELLLRHEPKVWIRDCDLLAAASWERSRNGQYLLTLLFQHDPSAVATEAVIVKAIQKMRFLWVASDETLRLLLKHDGGLRTTPAMLEAVDTLSATCMAEVTKILLEREPLDKATTDMLEGMSKRAALKIRQDREKYNRVVDAYDESSVESDVAWGAE